MESVTGKFVLELRNERGDTLVEWATSRKYKIMNTMVQKKAWRRWTWKSPNGVTNTEIGYILTNRPNILTDIIVVNQINIGSYHRLVMSNNKLDLEVKMKTLLTKSPPRVEDRIPTRIEKPIRDTTGTRRHRHHE